MFGGEVGVFGGKFPPCPSLDRTLLMLSALSCKCLEPFEGGIIGVGAGPAGPVLAGPLFGDF